MNPNESPLPSAEQPTRSSGEIAGSFMATFLHGNGRNAEAYDDSWAADALPDSPVDRPFIKGPERALG